ncbi:MAG: isoprenylcysteine carboxylmethyltransferase family protein [Ginsengibacter sp.]
MNHWLLGLFWVLYCASHSILASGRVKYFFGNIPGNFFRYYRLVYTVWSSISLLLILYFQYSFSSVVLMNPTALRYISLIIFACPGFVIMMISILKYFTLLSGVRTLYEEKPPDKLQLGGIHKYTRHPLYLGTLLFIWGLFFIFPLLNNLIAVISISVYVLIGIRLEEKKLLLQYGKAYEDYITHVPMLVPDFRWQRQNKKGQPRGRP